MHIKLEACEQVIPTASTTINSILNIWYIIQLVFSTLLTSNQDKGAVLSFSSPKIKLNWLEGLPQAVLTNFSNPFSKTISYDKCCNKMPTLATTIIKYCRHFIHFQHKRIMLGVNHKVEIGINTPSGFKIKTQLQITNLNNMIHFSFEPPMC